MATLKEVTKSHDDMIKIDAVIKWFDDWDKKKDSQGKPYPPLKHGFTYGLSMNEDHVAVHMAALNKTLSKNEAYQAYDKVRMAIAIECSEKDEKGQARREGNKFLFKDGVAFTKRLISVQQSEEHKEAFKEFEAFLQEEVTLEVYEIKFDDVPDVPLDIMRILKVFIAPPE